MLQPDGSVLHQLRFKFVNRAEHPRVIRVHMVGADDARLVMPLDPYPLKPTAMATVTAFVISPRTGFEGGRRTIAFELTDGAGWHDRETWELLGPATPVTSGGNPR